MSQDSVSIAARASGMQSETATTRRLLACGVVAGPLFVAAGLVQAFTIPGFDLRRHYLSQLSSGDLGWIQMANFIVTGLLFAACAAGMWRTLRGSRVGRLGPALIGAFGLCFAAAGFFVADPANGFPLGTPAGAPQQISWHGMLHGVAAVVAFLLLFAACLAFAYREARARRWGWAAASAAAGLVSFGLPSVPNPWGGVFLLIAASVGFAWILALAARLMAEDRS